MSVTAMYLQESARRKFLINSTYIMSRKAGIKPFQPQEAEMSLTPMYLHESARRKFLMNSRYIMSRK